MAAALPVERRRGEESRRRGCTTYVLLVSLVCFGRFSFPLPPAPGHRHPPLSLPPPPACLLCLVEAEVEAEPGSAFESKGEKAAMLCCACDGAVCEGLTLTDGVLLGTT